MQIALRLRAQGEHVAVETPVEPLHFAAQGAAGRFGAERHPREPLRSLALVALLHVAQRIALANGLLRIEHEKASARAPMNAATRAPARAGC